MDRSVRNTHNGVVRVAMWSGPRNISTALMRSWDNRPDTFVCDEPLYAHYLKQTGAQHPGALRIVDHYEEDWSKVVDCLTRMVPEGKRVFYQKHMAHHLLPHIERDWLDRLTNCFLIREPREMLSSLAKILPEPTLNDTGLAQQVEIFELVRAKTGEVPPVLDSRDVLENPRRQLELLCDAVEVEFTDRMLSWPPGSRKTDGIWASDWYGAVEKTTTFLPYRPKPEPFPDSLDALYAECREYYEMLYEHRLGQKRQAGPQKHLGASSCCRDSTKKTAI